MEGLEDGHQVVPAWLSEIGGVSHRECHSIGHAGALGVLAGGGDGIKVEIDAVYADAAVRLCMAIAGPVGSARDVGDPRRRFGPKPNVEIGDRGEPLAAEQVDEPGPVGLGPALRLPGNGGGAFPTWNASDSCGSWRPARTMSTPVWAS